MKSYVYYSMLSMSGSYGLHYYDIDVSEVIVNYPDHKIEELLEVKDVPEVPKVPKVRRTFRSIIISLVTSILGSRL